MAETSREDERRNDELLPQTVVERHLVERGMVWEGLEHYARWDHERGLYLYQLDVRRCAAQEGETLIVVKAIQDDEPMIAFHSDTGLVGTLYSLARRARSGKLTYRPDERPGVLLEKVLPEIAYHRERFG